MSFTAIPFLILFFPVSLALHRLCPGKLRTALLVILSLLFYAWADIESLPLLLFSVVFNYLTGLELAEWKANKDKASKSNITELSTVEDKIGA